MGTSRSCGRVLGLLALVIAAGLVALAVGGLAFLSGVVTADAPRL